MNTSMKISPDRLLLAILVDKAKGTDDIKQKSDIKDALSRMLNSTNDELFASEVQKQLKLLNANSTLTASQLEKARILELPIIMSRITPALEDILKIESLSILDAEYLVAVWQRDVDYFTARQKINNILKAKGVKQIWAKHSTEMLYYADMGSKDKLTLFFRGTVMAVGSVCLRPKLNN
jgi:hypothetical protein